MGDEFTEIVREKLADIEKSQATRSDLSAFGVPYSKQLTVDLVEAGKRIADALNQKLTDYGYWMIKTRWMAFSLQDGTAAGGKGGDLYDNKRDAVRHQSNEFQWAYICFIHLGHGADPRECAVFLKFTRDAYNRGMRLPDPDNIHGGAELIMTTRWRDAYRRRLGI